MVLLSLVQNIIEVARVLLEKENVSFDPLHIIPDFFSLPLLIQEAELKERLELFPVWLCAFALDILDLNNLKDIPQQGMKHEQIIELGGLFLLFSVTDLDLWDILLKYLFPTSLELLSRHDSVIIVDTSVGKEHRRVSVAEFQVDFAHLPLPGLFFELREVGWEEVEILLADVLEFNAVVFTVELEGAVHDTAVVEGSDGEVVGEGGG